MLRPFRLGCTDVFIVPVIRGLVSEGRKVRELIASRRFQAVGMSVGPEELEALSAGGEPVQLSSEQDDLYMRYLSHFGAVRLPPPCFVEALQAAECLGIECFALDMDEEAFTELFVLEVSGLEMIRYSLHLKRLSKQGVDAESPEDLVLRLDALLTRFRGRRKVEEARERHIANAILESAPRYRTLLALVELERFEGVYRRVLKSASEATGQDPGTHQ